MANASTREFDKRLTRIHKRHQKLARGYTTAVTPDGLIVARPARYANRGIRFPFRGLALSFAALMLFKAFVFVNFGPASYNERVAKLAAGTPVEQVGAWVMQADSATIWLAVQVKMLLASIPGNVR